MDDYRALPDHPLYAIDHRGDVRNLDLGISLRVDDIGRVRLRNASGEWQKRHLGDLLAEAGFFASENTEALARAEERARDAEVRLSMEQRTCEDLRGNLEKARRAADAALAKAEKRIRDVEELLNLSVAENKGLRKKLEQAKEPVRLQADVEKPDKTEAPDNAQAQAKAEKRARDAEESLDRARRANALLLAGRKALEKRIAELEAGGKAAPKGGKSKQAPPEEWNDEEDEE